MGTAVTIRNPGLWDTRVANFPARPVGMASGTNNSGRMRALASSTSRKPCENVFTNQTAAFPPTGINRSI